MKKQIIYPTGTSDQLVHEIDDYDTNCNIKQSTGPDGIHIVSLNNLINNSIIAIFSNAVSSEVAYTSFEPGANWGNFYFISN